MNKNKDEATKPEVPIDENAGKRGVYVQFDEKRLLRFDLNAMEWVENNVFTSMALPISVIIGNINRIGFTRVALRGALGVRKENGIITPIFTEEQVTDLIYVYRDNVGDLEDIPAFLTKVYELSSKNLTKSAKAKEKKTMLEDPGGSR
jgi:hypothetical protein